VITKDYVLVNPKLISASEDMDIHYEGCLSIPDTYGQVKRHKKIKVSALDENGNEIKINTSGFFARVIQHEMDHLDGILFTSKMIGKVLTEQELDNLNSKDSKTVSE
jgi:peptide deformylase